MAKAQKWRHFAVLPQGPGESAVTEQHRRFETIVASLLQYGYTFKPVRAWLDHATLLSSPKEGVHGQLTPNSSNQLIISDIATSPSWSMRRLEIRGIWGPLGRNAQLGSASSVVVESKSIRRSRTWPHQKPKRDGDMAALLASARNHWSIPVLPDAVVPNPQNLVL
ncbi:hypothetical protein VTG60DRAFT_867 [Thermothelomyces hinnuleus]